MQRIIKFFLLVVLAFTGTRSTHGFALLGPLTAPNGADAWQVPTIGYDLTLSLSFYYPGDLTYLGDVGGPRNIGEEYRRNIPVLYYAYDDTFSGFFGEDAETSIDGAFAILNSLTNVDSYSAQLTEFPLESQQFNLTARALHLTDLKSITLHHLVEQMGLAQPERFVWALHDRYLPPKGKCPFDEEYLVVQRNYGIVPSSPTNLQYSAYVNGILYGYSILESCAGPDPVAVALPSTTDLDSDQYTAVASGNSVLTPAGSGAALPNVVSYGGLQLGGYYTGLTRDDVAGLRYLLRTNNINYENPGAGAQMIVTNLGGTIPLTTSNYNELYLASLTNDPVAILPVLFPNVIVASYTNSWTNVCTPNLVTYFTNYPGEPAGSQTLSVTVTNGTTCNVQERFSVTFANVYTNANFTNSPFVIIRDKGSLKLNYSTNTVVTKVTTSISEPIGAPAGSPLVTNTTTTTVVYKGQPTGEYIAVPPGQCGWEILYAIATNVVKTTNVVTSATNNTGFIAQTMYISKFTNHTFIVRPITCTIGTNGPGKYQGIKHVQFVRVPDTQIDPLSGNFLTPITNFYTMVVFNPLNSQLETRRFQRVVTAPDILFQTSDEAAGPAANPGVLTLSRTIPNYDVSTALPNLAGPGVINGRTIFTFNRVGDVFANAGFTDTNSFLPPTPVGQQGQITTLAWASFDGSTNPPEIYPNGTSIENLENSMVISISPQSPLPAVAVGDYYSVTFTATGGVSPYTWGIASGSNPLPDGLSLDPQSGLLSGAPTSPAGTYDFTLELVDSQGRVVDLPYSITLE